MCLLAAPTLADYAPASFSISVSGTQRDTEVTFMGFCAPNALVTFQEDGAVIGNVSANSSGGFVKNFTARVAGTHSYGIFAEDSHSRLTPTYGFILNLISSSETDISNLLLPTTIDVDTSTGVKVLGSAAPNSQITIFVHSNNITGSATTGNSGDWNYQVTDPLDTGGHTAYAETSMDGGLQSISSRTVNFNVTCRIADLDCNGRVDMVDFSILMYYWGTTNATADINGDHIVDLTDFSIMMFYWQG